MKAVYNILNNQDKVTMKFFYHIICDPYLGEGLYAIKRIPCDFTGCVEQLPNHWLPNSNKNLQAHYAIETKTCKYSSILRGYNKWYIAKLT